MLTFQKRRGQPFRLFSKLIGAVSSASFLEIVFIVSSHCASAQTGSIELGWSPSTYPGVAGYTLLYGPFSGVYTSSLNVGTNLTWTVSALTQGCTCYFAVQAYDSNGFNSPLSSELSWRCPVSPSITTQPLSQTAISGAAVTLSVGAAGDSPLSYQWLNGLSPIPGATNSVLAWPAIQTVNAGNYSVIVSNAGGAATSAVVGLTVMSPSSGAGGITNGLLGWWEFNSAGGTTAVDSSGNGNNGILQGFTGTCWVPGVPGGFGNALQFSGHQYVALPAITIPSNFTITGWVYPTARVNHQVIVFSAANTVYYSLSYTSGNYYLSYYDKSADHPSTAALTPGAWNFVVVTFNQGAVTFYINGNTPDASTYTSQMPMTPSDFGGTTSAYFFTGMLDNFKLFNRVLSPAEIATEYAIIRPPAIIAQPQSQIVNAAMPASFTSAVTGSSPLSFQWFFGTNSLAGATNNFLAWASVGTSNSGNYYFTVSNAAGALTSSVATLTVITPPSVLLQPQSQSLVVNTPGLFSTLLAGTAPLAIQWYFGTTPLPGATNATLAWPAITTANAGNYYFTVSNAAGTITSSVATLTVISPPSVLLQPQSQSLAVNTPGLFSPLLAGTPPLAIQWYFGTTPLPGATNATLAWPAVSTANAGNYYFTVSNAAGTLTSSVATLTVITPPTIITQPQSQSLAANSSASFLPLLAGTPPLAIQWYFGTTPLPEATNATLAWSAVTATNAGDYYFTVSNAAGTLTSSVATLTVITPPTIITQPQSQSLAANSSASFLPLLAGTAPLAIQWYFGTTPLPGATNATLAWPAITITNAGNYYFTVSNAAGALTSSVATLTVIPTIAMAAAAGVYNGLFFQTNLDGTPSVTEATAGLLGNCVVTSLGAFSASFYVGGLSFPAVGTFDASGNSTTVVPRVGPGLSNLTAALHLGQHSGTPAITGTISSAAAGYPWSAALLGEQATNPYPQPLTVSLVLTPGTAANAPANFASATGSIVNGVLSLSGVLGDSEPFSQSVTVSQDGNAPLFANLYNSSGLLDGWINLAGGVVTGNLAWIRPAGITVPSGFSLGFTNSAQVSGAAFGPGVGCLGLSGPTTIVFTCATVPTGHWMVLQDSSGNQYFRHTGSTLTVSASSPLTFWACAGSNNPAASGAITSLVIGSSAPSLVSIDVSALAGLQTLSCPNNGALASVNASGCLALASLSCNYCNGGALFFLNNCSSLNSFSLISSAITVSIQNSIIAALPAFIGGSHTLYLSNYAPANPVGDAAALLKGWIVNRPGG